MDSGCRLVFDPTPSRHHRGGHMLLLGRTPNPIFQASNKRRLPFFTSSDDLLEEEYYDEQTPEKKRRLTPEQVQMLEVSFESDNKLEPERKSELAKKLGLQPRQVAVWFQNRRARWRTKQLERDFDRIKASHDALVAENGSLRMDNSMLRSQVLALTEKIKSENVGTVGVVGDHEQAGEQPKTVVERNSVESYFQESFHGGFGMGIQSEEDDGSDEGCSYLPADVFEVGQNNDVGWWVWS